MVLKKPTCGYYIFSVDQILIFDGHVKVREHPYTRVIFGVNTNLNRIDSKTGFSHV